MDDSPTLDFIMRFYESQLKAGHSLREIDETDILAYMEITVYKACTDYVKKLSEIDTAGGGVAGSL